MWRRNSNPLDLDILKMIKYFKLEIAALAMTMQQEKFNDFRD